MTPDLSGQFFSKKYISHFRILVKDEKSLEQVFVVIFFLNEKCHYDLCINQVYSVIFRKLWHLKKRHIKIHYICQNVCGDDTEKQID